MMKKLLISFLFLFVAGFAFAGDYYTGRGDVAIRGYDVVAYFKENKAVKGSAQFSYDYDGVTWQFASAENLNDFKASPSQYIPQYGGHCAYGMSSYGGKSPVQPDQFTVKEGKLYLNYNAGISRTFRKNIDEHISQADKNWKEFLSR